MRLFLLSFLFVLGLNTAWATACRPAADAYKEQSAKGTAIWIIGGAAQLIVDSVWSELGRKPPRVDKIILTFIGESGTTPTVAITPVINDIVCEDLASLIVAQKMVADLRDELMLMRTVP